MGIWGIIICRHPIDYGTANVGDRIDIDAALSVSSSSQYYGGHSQSSSSTIEKLPDASLLLNLHSSLNSTMKLPDASLLLNSPTLPSHQVSGNNHSSRVEAAIEKNERKRELNASASSLPHGKLPKGNLPHLKNTSSSVVGLLVPPQLSGRSNVVTEDISKLFVKRAANQSSH
ncbi:hypothetical protein Syun_001956 [Stephania yunnanensis]|uniref:Uncharacterized protein n=1 Tax=Stephania yunnanensis TaxID=152371 RepID=A0AAP0LF27_9MAGN